MGNGSKACRTRYSLDIITAPCFGCCLLVLLLCCRDPVPIVQPEWVVASLRAGQLLPVRGCCLGLGGIGGVWDGVRVVVVGW